jgi:hypothetical protein
LRERLRVWFFALCPLALASGILLQVNNVGKDRFDEFNLKTSRAQAIQTARDFLQSQGLDTTGWKAYSAAKTDSDLFRYLRMKPPLEASVVRELVPPASGSVLFQSPDGKRRATVIVSLQGRVLGFDFHSAVDPIMTPDKDGAEELRTALSLMAADPQLRTIFARSTPEIATIDQGGNGKLRRFTWHAPFGSEHELELEFSATIRNAQVLSRNLAGTIDRVYAARRLGAHETLLALFGICYSLFGGVVAIYSVIIYVRRAAQKEVSHSRMLWIALLVSMMMIGVVLSGTSETMIQTGGKDTPVPLAFIYTILCLGLAGLGLLVGIAYSSGEGEVREAYPGKLTSLDALLLGKVFSRNVGRSVLVGMAFASWFLLLSQLLQIPLAGHQRMESLNSIHLFFMRAPWVSFLIAQPAIGLVFAVGGLLQPLAFVTRTIGSKKTRIATLIFLTALGASGAAAARVTLPGVMVALVVSVVSLLAPFFAYDLLASLISFIATGFVSSLIIAIILFPGWTGFALSMGGVMAVTLCAAFAAWRRGRTWKDEEVRPEYARHISERLALQEEVAAAREAQLRLLPQAPPFIPGLSIFASCQPAQVVGGDFYDFFNLSEGRLGIFVAEGGNRGLASALTIALAKGYLMHAARRTTSPTEVIQRLEATLGSVLEGNTVRTTVAYAVIDVRRGTLSYARTGAYPKVIVAGFDGDLSQSERQVTAAIGNRVSPIWEGHANLSEGDGIIFYTDGIARRLADRTSMLQEDWVRQLALEQPDANALHGTLLKSIGASIGSANGDLEDDLTAIVIRFTKVESAALAEGVA